MHQQNKQRVNLVKPKHQKNHRQVLEYAPHVLDEEHDPEAIFRRAARLRR